MAAFGEAFTPARSPSPYPFEPQAGGTAGSTPPAAIPRQIWQLGARHRVLSEIERARRKMSLLSVRLHEQVGPRGAVAVPYSAFD